jgi:hypothetical protein
MDETWHVTLFHVHPDGTATSWAWWVDSKYAADMIAHMGEPDAESLLSVEQVQRSIAHGAEETWLYRDVDHG